MTAATAGERMAKFAPTGRDNIKTTRILGVPISVVDMESAVAVIVGWAKTGVSNYVCVRDVHGVMLAQEDAEFLAVHERAGLVTPDGMPLVWIARSREGSAVGRVCGADLVDALSAASEKQGLRHYFYGGKRGVAENMAATLQARYPGLKVVGAFCPPFGGVSKEEDEAIVCDIAAARPHIVWIGLSTPKQELWMRDHVDRIPGATLIGIGAAFDFHTGMVARAPVWMQRVGLEWFHRLISEPRRLWRRYLIIAPKFALLALREQINGSSASRTG
jgi:N-acetylglucosaminyldiphosphoundecaprenol N-acetyl-beta-D-mannosaminyltransferase